MSAQKNALLVAILTIALSACTMARGPHETTSAAGEPAAAPAAEAMLPPAASSAATQQAQKPVIATRDYLVRGQGRFSDPTPYPLKSVILLTTAASGKNKKACEQFATMMSGDIAPTVIGDATFVPTYWLLKNDVSDRKNCNQILNAYDFEAASGLLQRYGVPIDSKGPVLVVADQQGRYAFIDMSKANDIKVRSGVRDWATMMRDNGMKNVTLKSRNLGDVLKALACNTGEQVVVAQAPPNGADPTDPATFGFDPATLKWKKPSLFSVGTYLFGGPFLELACGIVET